MTHTPEPWTDNQIDELLHGCKNNVFTPTTRANRKRMVDAVNGCAGLTEDEITQAIQTFKAYTMSPEGKRVVAKQIAERAAYRACVEALKLINTTEHVPTPSPGLDICHQCGTIWPCDYGKIQHALTLAQETP